MQLIADSGSTKTAWCLTKDGEPVKEYRTIGYNPQYFTSEEVVASLKESLLPKLPTSIEHITHLFFYGAGCSTPKAINTLEEALASCFPKAKIEVQHDLLAAARAACGRESGIACILGTGSNSCYFDGEEILDNVTSLGFFLGDEGSGGHLGRKFLKAYYYRDLPLDLKETFEASEFYHTKQELFDKVYRNPLASRSVAKFSEFCGANAQHPFIKKLVQENFREFVTGQVLKYEFAKDLPIHFIGSVACYFQEELKKVLQESNLQCGSLIRNPIEGLIKFHKDVS